jgi:predicted  nucleic acid-binding Zn-ribbon protein
LNQEKHIYVDELKMREEKIKSGGASDISIKYRQLINEQDLLSRQLIETDEALRAANMVINTADNAIGHLDNADSWAAYDIWVKGGMFSHAAKYSHIDDAQAEYNKLSSQMEDLQKELADIKCPQDISFIGIDSTTRVIDFCIDNIFTDLSVRNKIRDDRERLEELKSQITQIINRLQSSRAETYKRLCNLELIKNDLIISI